MMPRSLKIIMKRLFSFLLLSLITFSSFLALSPAANAAIFDSDDILKITQKLPDDLYAAGRVIGIEQTVNGDVLAAGAVIEIDGSVLGDVMLAGANIVLNGNVSDDARIAGHNIEIHGKVQGDLLVGGGRVLISDSSTIFGDVHVGAGELIIQGRVKGKVVGGVGSISIEGKVEKDVELTVDQDIDIHKQGFINGNLNYASWKPLGIPKERIGGELIYSKIQGEKETPDKVMHVVQGLIFMILSFLILGTVVVKLAPKYSLNVTKTLQTRFWVNLLTGIVWAIVVPIVAVLLCITFIGLPLGLVLFATYGIVAVSAYVLAGYWIGVKIYKSKESTFWITTGQLVIGLVIISLLWNVPLVGWIIALVIFLASIGAMINTARGEKTPKKKR
jgi:cytoskeletal protein CcmA (bactofilin family)